MSQVDMDRAIGAKVDAAVSASEKVGLLRVLGPAHVWALGVGIVLVGEYMGWNFAVGKGYVAEDFNFLDLDFWSFIDHEGHTDGIGRNIVGFDFDCRVLAALLGQ